MTTASASATNDAIRSTIPARIDRLPWSPFHSRMVTALGIAWILDGLEITVAGAVAGKLTDKSTLGLSAAQVGLVATVYLIGEVFGALVFGKMSDRLGRKKLFMLTLGVYLVGSGLTAATFGHSGAWVAFFYATRFIAGMGIGGEYAAINSAIDELIPARYRGRVDIAVNGTYWAGAFLGTLGTFYFLGHFTNGAGWRLGFLLGPVLGLVILFVRRNLPESPRWQIMHGHERQANESIDYIEKEVASRSGKELPAVDDAKAIEIRPTTEHGYLSLAKVLFRDYPKRAVLGASLMISQSFLYNAIFFTYTLVLKNFYHVDPDKAPIYLIAFCVGNLAGPLTIGRLFDTVGRRKMISGTYIISGVLLAISGFMFNAGILNATTQTIAWAIIFYFASAGASAAYLTVSEIFPLEVRAKAIAIFFAIAQSFGAFATFLFGRLIGKGEHTGPLTVGYMIGAGFMIVGGVVAAFLAVDAEGKSLEDVATPLSAVKQRGPSESIGGLNGTVRAPSSGSSGSSGSNGSNGSNVSSGTRDSFRDRNN